MSTIFDITTDESWFWTSTTHVDGPDASCAAYVCFGRALGYFGPPGREEWINVHGAGAQRSDPKTGDPARFTRFDPFYTAFRTQLTHLLDWIVEVNNLADAIRAQYAPK